MTYSDFSFINSLISNQMKRFCFITMIDFLLILFSNGMLCISQDSIYILHPAIGEIVDRNAKTYYTFFPEVSKSKSEYVYIKQAGDSFGFKSYLYHDSLIIRQLDTSKIHWNERNIIKMVDYYPNLQNTYTNGEPGRELKSIVIKDNGSYYVNKTILEPGLIERLKFEYIYKERSQEMIEYSKTRKQGIDPFPLFLDFRYLKKK